MSRPSRVFSLDYTGHHCLPLVDGVKAGRVRLEALVRTDYPGRRLARNVLSGVRTVGFWDCTIPQEWGLDWHRDDGLELTFRESGTLEFGIDGASVLLEPDDLTVTRPWQSHRLGGPQVTPGRLHWLILDVGAMVPHQAWRWPPWLVLSKADLRELTERLRQNEQPVWHAPAGIRRSFQHIGQAVESDRAGSSVSRLAVCLNELFLQILELYRSAPASLDKTLSTSQRTVRIFLADLTQRIEHLAQEWTVEGMAEHCGLGVTQFIHHCRLLTNLTPGQYLNRCRLEAAARLLSQGSEQSVTAVANACGFSSAQYFATVFRRHYGQAPGEFRSAGGSRGRNR